MCSSSLLDMNAAALMSFLDSNCTRRFATEPEFCFGTSCGGLLRAVGRMNSIEGAPEKSLRCAAAAVSVGIELPVVSGSLTRRLLVGVTVEAVTRYVEVVLDV